MINNHIRIIVMESEWILRNLSQFQSSTGSVEYHPKMRCWDCWEWQRLRLRWPSCRSWHCGFPQWPLLARQGHCSGSRALGQPKFDDLARSMTAIRRYQQGFGIFICRFFLGTVHLFLLYFFHVHWIIHDLWTLLDSQPEDLSKTLKTMQSKKMFKQLVFYMESWLILQLSPVLTRSVRGQCWRHEKSNRLADRMRDRRS